MDPITFQYPLTQWLRRSSEQNSYPHPRVEADALKQRPVTLDSLSAIKKELTRVTKHNKAVKKNAIMMHPTTESERNLAEAWADNEREGPGLRSGPRKKVHNRWDDGDDGGAQSKSPFT